MIERTWILTLWIECDPAWETGTVASGVKAYEVLPAKLLVQVPRVPSLK
jgi:hypothetical protein